MSHHRPKAMEIFLHPGGFYFGDLSLRIRTVLGSCVAITLWHPGQRLGGICHFMVPSGSGRPRGADARYAEDALALFRARVRDHGTRPGDYRVKIFGGGSLFPSRTASIGPRNIEAARCLLEAHGFAIHGGHLAGTGFRHLLFDAGSGEAWVRHLPPQRGSSG